MWKRKTPFKIKNKWSEKTNIESTKVTKKKGKGGFLRIKKSKIKVYKTIAIYNTQTVWTAVHCAE